MGKEAPTSVLVRPRDSLARAGTIAVVVGGLPLFGVLYWLSAHQGNWRTVLVFHVLAVAVAALVWVRHHSTFTEVTPTHLTKQSFFTHQEVDRDRIASATIAYIWRPGSSEALPQLVVLDADGHCLLRMRGTFWSLDSMHTIAGALGVTVRVDETPTTLKEFLEAHPTAAYWYEGKPWLAVMGILVAFGTAFIVMSWIMMAIGAPSAIAP